MSSVIKSNILKKSEVTVLTYLIVLDLIKLTILIKPVFHNAMWNGTNYVPVLWFFIDCLTAVFPWVSGTTHSLCDLCLHACFTSSKYCPYLSFYQSYTFSHFQRLFLKFTACVWGISYSSYFMLLDANSSDPFSVSVHFRNLSFVWNKIINEHMDVFFMIN